MSDPADIKAKTVELLSWLEDKCDSNEMDAIAVCGFAMTALVLLEENEVALDLMEKVIASLRQAVTSELDNPHRRRRLRRRMH